MKKLIALFCCFALWLSGVAQSTKADSTIAGFIRTKGDSLYKSQKPPGIFVGILNGKKSFFHFGYAIPDDKIPFDSATVFEAGSITKTFTAYLLTSVLQQKRISDSTPIIAYLPDSLRSNKALASINFRSLMNHTSGLLRLPDNLPLDTQFPYDHYTINQLFSYLKKAVPKPDGKSNYSNLGMGLAGVLAQKLAGKDYATLLNTYILQPLGLKSANAKPQKKAQGYFEEQKQAFWKMDALAPAGGLQCTAADMLTYLQAMSLPGPNQSKVVDQLLQPTVSLSPVMHVGLAWHTLELPGKPVIYWHNGGTYGFSTFAAFVRNTQQAVIVIVNKFNTNSISDALGISIMKKILEN